MLFSVFALLLAIADVAFANPPAGQSTFCFQDNLLRAFQHTPTPAAKYCVAATGYPTFLTPTTYPATRLKSACSCFSKFTTVPTSTTSPSPACTPGTYGSDFEFVATGNFGHMIGLRFGIDRTKPCKTTGFAVSYICGYYDANMNIDNNIYFDNTITARGADNCFYPAGPTYVDTNGVDFVSQGVTYQFALKFGTSSYLIANGVPDGVENFSGTFIPLTCDDQNCPFHPPNPAR